jgi:uncharacterized membrane protein
VDLDTSPEVVPLVTDDAMLVEGIDAHELPSVEGFSSLYDTQSGTITAIVFGLGVVVVVQLLVGRIFSRAKSMIEALTFFATAMVAFLMAVYLCDLLIAGPDVLLLRAGERAAIVGFVKDTCLMVFAYFFGTRSNGASNDAH